MGQAKNRGSFEERRDLAIAKQIEQDIIDAEWRKNNPPPPMSPQLQFYMNMAAAFTDFGRIKL